MTAISRQNFTNYLNESLTRLDLSNKSIKLIDENAFIDLSKHLKQLLITNNFLLYLPNQFGNLTQLTTLDVSFNRLQSLKQTNFIELLNLRFLFLNNNRIKSIDGNAFAPLSNLEQLCLNKNLLTQFEENLFSTLSNLTSLNVGSNAMKNELLNEYTFNGLVSLKELNLQMCSLVNVNLDLFEKLPQLEKVYFDGNEEHLLNLFKLFYWNVTFVF